METRRLLLLVFLAGGVTAHQKDTFFFSSTTATPQASFQDFPHTFYDFYKQHCPKLPQPNCALDISKGCDADIADAPVRAFYNGTTISMLASVDLGSRGFYGSSLSTLKHSCTLYANSTNDMLMSDYDNHEWIHSTWYFPENNTVYALTHDEYHCDREGCPCYPNGCNGIPLDQLSFITGVTLLQSVNGGESWSHARPPPAHAVAIFPYAWNATIGATLGSIGFRSPSGIVQSRNGDGFYYATVTAGWGPSELGQVSGACMMRTRDLTDPSAWLAYGGGGQFNISLNANPWIDPSVDPGQHRCVPFTNTTYATLAYSTVYNQYIYFGTNNGDDDGGWWFALSDDFITWSDFTMVNNHGFLTNGGNGTIIPPPANSTCPGRFIMRNTSSDGAIFWEDPAQTMKRPVGSCEPCPGINVCQTFQRIPDADFDALENRSAFSCILAGYNATGVSHYYYPTVIDGSVGSTRPNFDEIGANATLFLVAQRCVNAQADGTTGNYTCSPFDIDGLLVRDIVQIPITFS